MNQRKKNMTWVLPLVALMFLCAGLVKTAVARVADFRVTTDTTATDTDNGVWVIVDILDSDGKVDPFAYQDVVSITVDIASLMGSVNGTGTVVVDGTANGVVMRQIKYDSTDIGRDTISVTVKEQYIADNGYTLTRVVGRKTVDVQVGEAANKAEYLKVFQADVAETQRLLYESQSAVSQTDAANSSKTLKVGAGRSVSLTLKAYANNVTVGNQNGEVTVKLVGTANYISANGDVHDPTDDNVTRNHVMDSGDDCVVKTYTVEMTNGVANLTIPGEDLTEAGLYKIYLSMPTGVPTPEEDYVANNPEDYYLRVLPRDPAKVAVMWADGKDYIGCGQPTYLIAVLQDEYGNVARYKTRTEQIKVSCTVGSKTKSLKFNKDKNDVNATATIATTDFSSRPDANETDSYSITCTLTDGDALVSMDTVTLDLTYYGSCLGFNATTIAAPTGLDERRVGNWTTTDSWNFDLFAGNATYIRGCNSTKSDCKVKRTGVTLSFQKKDANGFWTTIESAKVNLDGKGNVEKLRLTKAGENATRVCASYSGTDVYYAPACAEIKGGITIKPEEWEADIKLFKKAKNYDACAGVGTPTQEVDAITISGKGDSANVTIKDLVTMNATAVMTGKEQAGEGDYYARLIDGYGNAVNGTITITSANGEITNNGDNVTIEYTQSVTSDTLTLKNSDGSISITVPVTINWTAGVSKVEIIPSSDYLLTNSKGVATVRLLDNSGKLVTGFDDNLTLIISDPYALNVYGCGNFTDDCQIENGQESVGGRDEFSGDGITHLYFKVANTPGDVEISVRNASGTIAGSTTIHIVESINDIPGQVASVTADKASVTLKPGEDTTVTVTVQDADGKPLADKSIAASVDNSNIVTVSPTSTTTDANGQAVFTVTASSVESMASITLASEGKTAIISVTVASEEAAQEEGTGEEETTNATQEETTGSEETGAGETTEEETTTGLPAGSVEVEAGALDPSATTVTIADDQKSNVRIAPVLTVADADKGKTVNVYAAIVIPMEDQALVYIVTQETGLFGQKVYRLQAYTGGEIPAMETGVKLGDTLTVDISKASELKDLDWSTISGVTFQVYYGYATKADLTDFHGAAYTVNVE